MVHSYLGITEVINTEQRKIGTGISVWHTNEYQRSGRLYNECGEVCVSRSYLIVMQCCSNIWHCTFFKDLIKMDAFQECKCACSFG